MEKSQNLERLVARINALIESEEAEVLWNEKIPDPDNPSELRQIDVLIRKNKLITLIECRDRKRKQDVTWIEEIIGRRQSLGADFAVAVSKSGFTKGAISKAKKFGIVLRDTLDISDSILREWISRTNIIINLFKIENLKFTIKIPSSDKSYSLKSCTDSFLENKNLIYGLIENFIYKADEYFPKVKDTFLFSGIVVDSPEFPVQILNIPVSIQIEAKLTPIAKKVQIPSALLFRDPCDLQESPMTVAYPEAHIKELIVDKNKVGITFENYNTIADKNCFIRNFHISFDREIELFINLDELRSKIDFDGVTIEIIR